jgi:hypothetical protein
MTSPRICTNMLEMRLKKSASEDLPGVERDLVNAIAVVMAPKRCRMKRATVVVGTTHFVSF